MAKGKSKGHDMAMPMVDKKWMAKNDLDTLRRAGEVMRDRSRMAAVKSVAREEVKDLQKIAGKTAAPSGGGLGFAKR